MTESCRKDGECTTLDDVPADPKVWLLTSAAYVIQCRTYEMNERRLCHGD
jgi:hypothetical protein